MKRWEQQMSSGPAVDRDPAISTNDQRLINEAINRIGAARGSQHMNTDAMKVVLASELRRGRCDLFSLVRAGRRVLDEQ